MPDNINFNSLKGKHSFAVVEKPAWHQLGQVVDQAMTSAEAIELALLDYEVGKQPVYMEYPEELRDTFGKKFERVPSSYATYRMDSGKIFSTVGSRYEIVQNKEAFAFFDSIVGEGKAIFETAGALGNGETIFMTAKLPYHIRVGGDDVVDSYILLTMAHDGSSSVQAMVTHIRVVCWNTLTAAISRGTHKISIRHTKSVHDNLRRARQLMNITSTVIEDNEKLFQRLSKIAVTEEQQFEYFNELFLTPEQITALALKGGKISYISSDIIPTKRKNMIESIQEFSYSGIGQDMPTTKGTAFGAYNAITGYLQHLKSYKDQEAKFKSTMLSTDYTLNNTALRLAVSKFGANE